MKFLIQTISGEIKHDFSFALMESFNYHKQINDKEFKYSLTDETTEAECVPVGSVEFVSNYMQVYHYLEVKPINIPSELFRFANRLVFNGTEKDVNSDVFIKSMDKIKSIVGIHESAPKGNYQISDIIDNIISEWRVFVFHKEIVGLKNYSGEFDVFPDMDTIRAMVDSYVSSPIAYTLDVAIINEGTVVIEVHDFFSCGLYGFDDYKVLPYMFSQSFYERIR